MFNTSKKSKKTKKRDFKVSPLILAIAVIEVILLVVISSYAWYFIRASKVIGSGTISVDADSGLDIDFQYSNVDDYINIWNYVDPDDFKFEPATSLDGRNIYFPTTGTFNSVDTEEMVFRDGTVNDINSKYLSIDFELSNTSEYDQYVYLNNNSFFKVKDGADETKAQESRALRLAFYQNDGNSGNVGSSLLKNPNSSSDGGSDSSSESTDAYTVYFDNSTLNWGNVYAYFWDSDNGSTPTYLSAWPGIQMSRVTGKIYSITIDNPKIGEGLKYDKLIFNNNNGTQSSEFNLKPIDKTIVSETSSKWKGWHKFNKTTDLGIYSENTVYFLRPGTWTSDLDDNGIPKVYCHAWTGSGSSTNAYTTWPGDQMTYVGSGIYSYSYDSSNTGGFLFNNNGQNSKQTEDITISAGTNGGLYYCTGSMSGNKLSASLYNKSYAQMEYKTIYLFNTYAWSKPYANVSINSADDTDVASAEIAMTSLSGNVYYCTVPEIFDRVYFHQKGETASNKKTQKYAVDDQKVYRPTDVANNSGYECTTFYYSSYIKDTGYPVISPGVSAGFQRPYSPVITINDQSGLATEIIPAYSNSIDNYILGSGTPLFVLKSGHMASLSMIMWLEGTDSSAVDELYPGNTIDFKLEFSTLYYTPKQEGGTEPHVVNPGDSASYTYNFYDKTREIWTSDRQPTESGVTVAPVMQLYDNTIKRGYLMHPSAYGSYGGVQKVSCWTVDAPQSIARLGHDIIFRRVNPYDEDEVWNYWHAGPVAGSRTKTNGVYNTYTTNQPLYDIAFSGGDTVSFTAFADGSPIPTMSGLSTDTDGTYKVPDDSCGGLWGNHSVRTVTVYDGLRNQPLKDDNGVLTINYKYTYTSSTESSQVKIEYKASSANPFYYVIVPYVAFANETRCAFKRYKFFDDDYAINSEKKNPDITFVRYYGKNQIVAGDYFELNEETGGNTDYSYWGSDMLYIQTNADTKNYVYTSSSSNDSNARLFQVHFFNSSDNSINKYAYLYYNSAFKPSTGDGYACVVPNDAVYNRFKLENCGYNGSTKYHISDPVTVKQASDVRITDPLNGSVYRDMKINYMEENGITATYIGITLYLQTNQTDGKAPGCYVSSASNGEYTAWPGIIMSYDGKVDSSGTTLYKYHADYNVSKYNKVIFAYRWNSGSVTQSQELTFNVHTIQSNKLYESKNSTTVGELSVTTSNVTLKTSNDWTAETWPHLTFKAS